MKKLSITYYDNGRHEFLVSVVEAGDEDFEFARPISREFVEILEQGSGGSTGFLEGCGWNHSPRPADAFIKLLQFIPKFGRRYLVRVAEDAPFAYKRILFTVDNTKLWEAKQRCYFFEEDINEFILSKYPGLTWRNLEKNSSCRPTEINLLVPINKKEFEKILKLNK